MPHLQKALTVASPAAVVHALMGVPEAHINEQQAQALRMLGSMKDILTTVAEELMCCGDLSRMQCGLGVLRHARACRCSVHVVAR